MTGRTLLIFSLLLPSTSAFVGVPRLARDAIGTNKNNHGKFQPISKRDGALSLGASSTTYDSCDVAIMGGGFGGLYTALAISSEAKKIGEKVDIALVDPSDRFVFLPLLYDLTMGSASDAEVCPTYANLLEGTSVRHIKASFDGFSGDTKKKPPSCALLTGIEKATNNGGEISDKIDLSFRASVVAVGATPQAILASVPGAAEFAQPFYTKDDAYATREMLFRMEQKARRGETPRIAVVGGGYGGVELAACVARRLPDAHVTLLSKGPPMGGTRAEPLVEQALQKLKVRCETCIVDEIQEVESNLFTVRRSGLDDETDPEEDVPFDAVLWTAGSVPAHPVQKEMGGGLALSPSGRLSVDKTLRCSFREVDTHDEASPTMLPAVWALGDCSEIIPVVEPAIPKTAQAAMQQSSVVASNVVSELYNRKQSSVFEFEDLGSVLSLGGPNAAILGPTKDSQITSLLLPLLDTARVGLGVADSILAGIVNSPQVDKNGNLTPVVENLGLSLGGYGLGVDPQTTPGTISGTLSGAARRAIYVLRMPTNKQRASAGASALLSSAFALAKEASDQIERNNNDKR